MKYIIINELEKLGVGKITETRTGWLNCRCPFHKDNDPSFGININTGGYYCFGCGIKGIDVASFLKKIYGNDINVNDYVSAQKFFMSKVASKYNRNIEEMTQYDTDAKFEEYYRILRNDFTPVQDHPSAVRYLKLNRNFTDESIARSGILFAQQGDYAGRFIFPLSHKVGFHSRLLIPDENSSKWKMCVNNSRFQSFIYGLDQIKGSNKVIIVESMFDRLYLLQNGFNNVITTLSTNFTYEQYAAITGFSHYIFCYDNDENLSGERKAKQHIRFILENMQSKNCYFVHLPKGKDPNECTPQELTQAFTQMRKMRLK